MSFSVSLTAAAHRGDCGSREPRLPHGVTPVSNALPVGEGDPAGTLGFKQSSLYHIARVLRHHTLQRFQVSTASQACYCPLQLSPAGKPVDPLTFLPVSPDCVRDTPMHLMAHARTP